MDGMLANQYFRLNLLKCSGAYSKSSDSKLEPGQSVSVCCEWVCVFVRVSHGLFDLYAQLSGHCRVVSREEYVPPHINKANNQHAYEMVVSHS